MQLIEDLARTNKYLPLCQKYAKREWKRDELHQEFLLRLCEIGEKDLKEAQDGGYLDWHCFTIISNIWNNRNRVKCYDKGATNPLFELTGIIEIEAPEELLEYEEPVDFTPYVSQSIKQIQKDINSEDMILSFRARVFAYSVGMKIENGVAELGGRFKSIRQFSETTKIPMSAAHAAYTYYRKLLKNKLKI